MFMTPLTPRKKRRECDGVDRVMHSCRIETNSTHVSDNTTDRYEDAIVVDISVFKRDFSVDVFCYTGPCEWQLIAFHHDGNCVATLPYEVTVPRVGAQIDVDGELVDIFPPP